jgi:hypothetical protein
VTEQLIAMLNAVSPSANWALVARCAGLLVIVAILFLNRRQRLALQRVEERLTHVHSVLSLLTNTTEDGLRSVALEVTRLAGAAETKPRVVVNARQRIASAAGHGRSVQDIAATEQVSEGEVLLHLLIDKLRPEAGNAEVC